MLSRFGRSRVGLRVIRPAQRIRETLEVRLPCLIIQTSFWIGHLKRFKKWRNINEATTCGFTPLSNSFGCYLQLIGARRIEVLNVTILGATLLCRLVTMADIRKMLPNVHTMIAQSDYLPIYSLKYIYIYTTLACDKQIDTQVPTSVSEGGA